MASMDQVTALVAAHVERDHDRFRAVTLQIAAGLKSQQSALYLRRLIERPQAVAFTPLPSANGLLSMPSNLSTLDDMVLAPALRERLDRVILEQSRRLDLLAAGLRPAHKILFSGPSGVGKTMAAGAVAQAVKMPLFRVELHSVISSYMGETASKLSKVFDHVRTMPGVYLFDEFDALGSNRRGSGTDGASAEARRTLNSLLQFIDDDRSDSVLIAATNLPEMLDPAVYRRFDETIMFTAPSSAEVTTLVDRALPERRALDLGEIYAAVANPKLGHADLCAALDRVRKDHLLTGSTIGTAQIVDAIARRTHVVVA